MSELHPCDQILHRIDKIEEFLLKLKTMKPEKLITKEKFEAVKKFCPVVCGTECSYSNCPGVFWVNILVEEWEQ